MYTSIENAEFEMRQAAYGAVSLLTMIVAQKGGTIYFSDFGEARPAFSDGVRADGLYVENGTLYFFNNNNELISLINEDDIGRLYDIINFLRFHTDIK